MAPHVDHRDHHVHPQDGAVHVTTVLVTCGDTPYLQTTLKAVAAQRRRPDHLLVVDVAAPGRELGSGRPLAPLVDEICAEALLSCRVVSAPAATNFGQAVAAGLEQNAKTEATLAQRRHARTGEIPKITDEDATWLWFLHDDSAPGPDALAHMLREVELATSIAMVGCKHRGWAKPDRLLSVGIRATSTTRRLIECDPDDIDQGQLDGRRDVLGVGSAGALIREDIFHAVGGFDPALGPFNDGLELSRRVRLAGYRVVVVPTAVVQHARASYQGIRSSRARRPDISRSFAARRRAQLFTWISGVPTWQVPLVWLAIALLAPARALWRLARKDIDLLWAELRAAAAILAQPAAWLTTRRRTRAVMNVPRSTLASIYTPRREISAKKREQRRSLRDQQRAEFAPSELERKELARLATKRRATAAAIALGLIAFGIAAVRPALHVGIYAGGALARAVGSFTDTLNAATSQWIDAGLGVAGPPEPILFTLLPALALSGDLALAIPLLYWLAVPLAGLTAWVGAGAATRSLAWRAWATIVWAIAPVLMGSLREGRIGIAIAHILLPLLFATLARSVHAHARDQVVSGMVGAKRVDVKAAVERQGEYREGTAAATARNRAAGAAQARELTPEVGPPTKEADEHTTPRLRAQSPDASAVVAAERGNARRKKLNLGAGACAALVFALITGAAPALLVPGIALMLIAQLFITHHRLAFSLIAVPAVVLHLPLLLAARSNGLWRLLFLTPGFARSDDTTTWQALGGGRLVEMHLGGLSATTIAIALAVILAVLAALALLAGGSTTIAVRLGWLVVLVGLVGVIGSRWVVVGANSEGAITAAVGPFVSLIIAGWLCALLPATQTLGEQLTNWWKTLRLVTIGASVVACLLIVATFATSALLGATSGEVHASKRQVTPALSRQLATAQGAERTLLLTPIGARDYRAELVGADAGSMLASPSVVALRQGLGGEDEAAKWLRTVIGQATSGFDDTVAPRLATAGIGVVVVPPATDLPTQLPPVVRAELVEALDATPGLARVTENAAGTIWRVSTAQDGGGVSTFARLIDGDEVSAIDVHQLAIETNVPAGSDQRELVLATRADPHWQATYDGKALPASSDQWRQSFPIPAHSGELVVSYHPAWLSWWKAGMVIVFVITALLAIPLRRRGEE